MSWWPDVFVPVAFENRLPLFIPVFAQLIKSFGHCNGWQTDKLNARQMPDRRTKAVPSVPPPNISVKKQPDEVGGMKEM